MSDTKYWREVANSGRGSTMTACLHKACDEIDRLTVALSAAEQRAEAMQNRWEQRRQHIRDNCGDGVALSFALDTSDEMFDEHLAAIASGAGEVGNG